MHWYERSIDERSTVIVYGFMERFFGDKEVKSDWFGLYVL
jgi:hypothetical protein